MRHPRTTSAQRQEGSVLVMVLILMAIMSLIGVTASMTSRSEIAIGYNTKISKQAFYAADSGIAVAPAVLSAVIEQGSNPSIPNITLNAGLTNEIMGYVYEDASADSISPRIINPDVVQAMNQSVYNMDIDRDPSGPRFMPGGGVQFASGAEGVGTGTMGGIMIFYGFDVAGVITNTRAKSHIDGYYRKVVGVAGQ